VLVLTMSFATALMAAWLLLLGRVKKEDWVSAAYSKVFDNTAAIKKLILKDKLRREKLKRIQGPAAFGAQLFLRDLTKEIKKLESANECLKNGNIKGLNTFMMPGYVLQREIDAIGKGGLHKRIIMKSNELYGKKHAVNKTRQLLAKLLSYPIIGIASMLTAGVLLIGAGSTTAGTAILGIGTVLIFVLSYAMYDELSDKVKKRRNAICKQFPGVVSKLALLVTSGMIMDRAWKETSYSQESEIYMEMRKTAEELDNLVCPEVAYSNFINRCNTKETARLASAIMQNLSKGNAEIGRLLKNMAREAWLERRRTAKKDAEKANSKLMIPTMLLLLTILVILMVPIAMNFSGI